MRDDETINHQRELLKIHRKYRWVLLKQIEGVGVRNALPSKITEFSEYGEKIQKIKQYLHKNKVPIENDPIDEAKLSFPPSKDNLSPHPPKPDPISRLLRWFHALFPVVEAASNTGCSIWLASLAIAILFNGVVYFFLHYLGFEVVTSLIACSTVASTIIVGAIGTTINGLKEPKLPSQGYKYVDNVSEIKDAVKQVRNAFDSYKDEDTTVSLPFSKEPISVRYFGTLDVWAHFDDEVKHGERIFRNMFGSGRPTKDTRYCSLNLGYEAADGNNTRVNKLLHSGFVKLEGWTKKRRLPFWLTTPDPPKTLFFLIHRGDETITKEKYEGGIWITTDDDKTVLLIAQLGKDNIPKQVAKFVKKVEEVKNPRGGFWAWLRRFYPRL